MPGANKRKPLHFELSFLCVSLICILTCDGMRPPSFSSFFFFFFSHGIANGVPADAAAVAKTGKFVRGNSSVTTIKRGETRGATH